MCIRVYINVPNHAPFTNDITPDNNTIFVNQNFEAANHIHFNDEVITIVTNENKPQQIINNIPYINIVNIDDKFHVEFNQFYEGIIETPADEAIDIFINEIITNGILRNDIIGKIANTNDENDVNEYNHSDGKCNDNFSKFRINSIANEPPMQIVNDIPRINNINDKSNSIIIFADNVNGNTVNGIFAGNNRVVARNQYADANACNHYDVTGN